MDLNSNTTGKCPLLCIPEEDVKAKKKYANVSKYAVFEYGHKHGVAKKVVFRPNPPVNLGWDKKSTSTKGVKTETDNAAEDLDDPDYEKNEEEEQGSCSISSCPFAIDESTKDAKILNYYHGVYEKQMKYGIVTNPFYREEDKRKKEDEIKQELKKMEEDISSSSVLTGGVVIKLENSTTVKQESESPTKAYSPQSQPSSSSHRRRSIINSSSGTSELEDLMGKKTKLRMNAGAYASRPGNNKMDCAEDN